MTSTYLYRLGSLVMDKSRIVGRGCNKLKTDPNLRKRGYYSIHSESAAIMDARGNGDTLIVVRIRKNGKLTMAKPCDKCLLFAKENGIKKIVYSDWLGEIQIMKL
jgi:deoxycytidylate deaminase